MNLYILKGEIYERPMNGIVNYGYIYIYDIDRRSLILERLLGNIGWIQ